MENNDSTKRAAISTITAICLGIDGFLGGGVDAFLISAGNTLQAGECSNRNLKA
jgi:hypothetical protein